MNRMLVIGSCTGAKQIGDCPQPLTESDFEDAKNLQQREAELQNWALPARELYLGWQHRYMMYGVEGLRRAFGMDSCTVKIVSAGYGVVEETRLLVPYEVTFQGKRPIYVRERAQRLGIPRDVRREIQGFPLVIFLLGKEYLHSILPPVAPAEGQRLLFFTQAPKLLSVARGITLIPAGRSEATKYGAGTVALKGKMFELLSRGLVSRPSLWDALLKDDSAETATCLMEQGADG